MIARLLFIKSIEKEIMSAADGIEAAESRKRVLEVDEGQESPDNRKRGIVGKLHIATSCTDYSYRL